MVSNHYSDAMATRTAAAADAATPVRDRLVAAAAEVFAERGYDGTRVPEVVRRAGLSTGAIYTNFRNKADLLLAAVGGAPIDEMFRGGTRPGATAEGLRRAGYRLPGARRRRWTLLWEGLVAARRDPEVAALLRERLIGSRDQMAGVVAAGHADGSVATDLDPGAVAEFCQALSMGFLVMEAVGLPHADDREWRRLIDRLVTGIGPTGPQLDQGRDTHGNQ
jgi:AcrR family transcriptional regulator